MVKSRNENNQENTEPKWFNSPLTIYDDKTLAETRLLIPEFERRTNLAMGEQNNEKIKVNNRLHTIVRKPFQKDDAFVPVGVVSKDYFLVQHSKVLEIVEKAIGTAGIDIGVIRSQLRITEYGERMHLSCFLPDEYSFDPGDGNPMALRLECFNSVEGSTRFRFHMGWFRFVCSNGLILGVTRFDFRRRHLGDIFLGDVSYLLSEGIKESVREKSDLIKWRKTMIKPERLREWILGRVLKAWGKKAATRVYHISQSGFDVDIVGGYKGKTPFDIPTVTTKRVPGCPEKTDNLFDLSQILAWMAKERRDVQEQLEMVEQIPDLIQPLMN